MIETEYKKLCAICDDILIKDDIEVSRVSIPWLHIIREHPVFTSNYEGIFDKSYSAKYFLNDLKRTVKYSLGWIRQFFLAIRANNKKPWVDISSLPSKVDFLFVSHLLNEVDLNSSIDSYFGDLPSNLADKGYSVAVILINHTKKFSGDFSAKYKSTKFSRLILADSLSFWSEFKILIALFKQSINLRLCAMNAVTPLIRDILNRAGQEAFSGGSRRSLRIHWQLKELAKNVEPNLCLITHEGHSWERIAFSALRHGYPKIFILGYLHAAIFRMQHAVTRNLSPEFNPDILLVPGRVSYNQLSKMYNLKNIPISILGSNKFSNAKPVSFINNNQSGRLRTCLVLPEGIESECEKLFSFSLNCALEMPETKFIWRLHPLLSFNRLFSKYPQFKKLPRNIELSKMTLVQDLTRSQYAVYRGSTTIVQAVTFGLTPLYLQVPGEMTIDPLYEVDFGRFVVNSFSQFREALTYKSNKKTKDFKALQGYCFEFYSELNCSIISDIYNNKYH